MFNSEEGEERPGVDQASEEGGAQEVRQEGAGCRPPRPRLRSSTLRGHPRGSLHGETLLLLMYVECRVCIAIVEFAV